MTEFCEDWTVNVEFRGIPVSCPIFTFLQRKINNMIGTNSKKVMDNTVTWTLNYNTNVYFSSSSAFSLCLFIRASQDSLSALSLRKNKKKRSYMRPFYIYNYSKISIGHESRQNNMPADCFLDIFHGSLHSTLTATSKQ